MAKTTISGQIQGLESLLGVKLLHRTTRRVSPTTDGAAYYECARSVLDDLDELEASVAQSRNVARGRVRVEMPSPVGTCLVIPSLPEFTAQHPQIQLDIGCSERVVDLVQEGIDCAFRGGLVTDQDLVCRPVGQMRFCLAKHGLQRSGHCGSRQRRQIWPASIRSLSRSRGSISTALLVAANTAEWLFVGVSPGSDLRTWDGRRRSFHASPRPG
jgi:DNA-binding transcriptional LysR family regulator